MRCTYTKIGIVNNQNRAKKQNNDTNNRPCTHELVGDLSNREGRPKPQRRKTPATAHQLERKAQTVQTNRAVTCNQRPHQGGAVGAAVILLARVRV